MDHMLLGASKGKHLMQGFGEVLQAALWIIGCHQVLNDIDQAAISRKYRLLIMRRLAGAIRPN